MKKQAVNKVYNSKILALLLCMVMVVTLVGCGAPEEVQEVKESQEEVSEQQMSYQPGAYEGRATGRNGELTVNVVFTENAINHIEVTAHQETEGFAEVPIEEIPKRIIGKQTLAVDLVSGATMTSQAILSAVEDCVIQAGGNVDQLMTRSEVEISNKVETLSFDIVVVGAGAAGSAAVLAASEKSDSVLLLEKTASPMGASTLAGGMFAAESQLQKEAGKTVEKEWLFEEYMKASNGYMNTVLVRAIIDKSSQTVDWLMANGMKLNLADAGAGYSFANVGRPTTLHGYHEGGIVAVTNLIKKFEENNGTVMFSTPATELLMDANGKVTGVTAKKPDGTILEINAEAVVLATGGFGGNEAMMKEYFGEKYTMGEVGSPTGDGLKMAWSAGAAEYGTATAHYFWQTFKGSEFGELIDVLGDDYFSLTDFSFYPHLRVNLLGQRFCDETTVSDFAMHGAQLHMQPRQTEFLILDTSVLQQIASEGYVSVEEHFGSFKDNRVFYMEFNEPNDTDELIKKENTPTDYVPFLEAALDTSVVYKGDTLEELADSMGVPIETFKSSVEQYNAAIETGKDQLFFSETDRLISISEGPYYAVKFVARNLSTLGGVSINENIEAVDEDGVAIPGLYVAGADAGGMYGKAYVNFEGGTLGFAYISGRMAGENAVLYVSGR